MGERTWWQFGDWEIMVFDPRNEAGQPSECNKKK